jgi:hypothetical protein
MHAPAALTTGRLGAAPRRPLTARTRLCLLLLCRPVHLTVPPDLAPPPSRRPQTACSKAADACAKPTWAAKAVPQSARQTYAPSFRKLGNKIAKADCALVTANTCYQVRHPRRCKLGGVASAIQRPCGVGLATSPRRALPHRPAAPA